MHFKGEIGRFGLLNLEFGNKIVNLTPAIMKLVHSINKRNKSAFTARNGRLLETVWNNLNYMYVQKQKAKNYSLKRLCYQPLSPLSFGCVLTFSIESVGWGWILTEWTFLSRRQISTRIKTKENMRWHALLSWLDFSSLKFRLKMGLKSIYCRRYTSNEC